MQYKFVNHFVDHYYAHEFITSYDSVDKAAKIHT